MPSPVAIVLAAGEGRRMGGPKALLMVNGKPLVTQHALALRAAGCRALAVVVRPEMEAAVRAACAQVAGVSFLAAATTSQAQSIVAGARSLGTPSDATLFVTPIDLLPPRPSTFRALSRALEDESVSVATPRFRGRGGHPILMRGRLLQDLVEGRYATLREVIRAAGPQRRFVELDDEAVTGDFDTPDDLQRILVR